ncbi:hypothetical protein SK3146_00928 [Paenibacillus konkukensis]|uniref:N-acetyltransferase domain-containing protein n=1 Tax=Paenibacillus konkukensis TaxID=2020716 RepID=A0ABY4RKE8_9BACL|nr:hypothetical protein [Paenibacillus konkukensis]UQZ81772.1 hypothetical protein SK3146_00928 [Paenibacillus konkukensis]
MKIECMRCTTDEDFARASLFMLENRHDFHRSFTVVDAIGLLYSYTSQGHLIQVRDAGGRVIGVLAYYHGTPEKEFKDKEVAFADMAIADRAHRKTKLFVQGLRFWVNEIVNEHPEVEELRLAALQENGYLCRLYSKFSEMSYTREGALGPEIVFCVKVNKIMAILKKFDKV